MRYLDDQLPPGSSPQGDPHQLALLAKAAVRGAQQDRQNAAFRDQNLTAASASAELQILPPRTLFAIQEQLGTALPTGVGGAADLGRRIFGQPVGDTRAFAELAARAARARNAASGEDTQNTATRQSGLRGQTGLDGTSRAELAARAARILNGMPPQGGAGAGPLLDAQPLAHVANAAGESPRKGQSATGMLTSPLEKRAFASGPIDDLVARGLEGSPPRYGLLPAVGAPAVIPASVSPDGSRVVDATNWVKAPSRIPRPTAGPDVKPNLRVSEPKRSRTILG